MDEIAFASAVVLSEKIRNRQIGCLELLDHYLKRAELHNPGLNAVVAWQVDNARTRARAADAALAKGENWGPLHGIPMTVKESFDVAGLPTTFGNPVFCGQCSDEECDIGRSFARRGRSYLRQDQRAVHADRFADLQRHIRHHEQSMGYRTSAGGSSGGAAAVLAAGLAALEAGSDIGGSAAQSRSLHRRLWTQDNLRHCVAEWPCAAECADPDRYDGRRTDGAVRRRSGLGDGCSGGP